jgi:hypothetical protein
MGLIFAINYFKRAFDFKRIKTGTSLMIPVLVVLLIGPNEALTPQFKATSRRAPKHAVLAT